MTAISATTRQELVQAVTERYRGGTIDSRRRILDEFVALTSHCSRVLLPALLERHGHINLAPAVREHSYSTLELLGAYIGEVCIGAR